MSMRALVRLLAAGALCVLGVGPASVRAVVAQEASPASTGAVAVPTERVQAAPSAAAPAVSSEVRSEVPDLGAGSQPDDIVVTVVMFYAPTCPHCHDIITTILPPMQEQYGDALDLVLINTRSPDGNRLFWDAMDWLGVSETAAGTPAILVGSRFLLGGEHATMRLADVVAEAMAEGGADVPAIPGLAEVVAAQRALPYEPLAVEDMSLDQRLALDPMGSSVALAMLAVMLVSVLLVVDAWRRVGPVGSGGGGWPAWLLPALCGAGLVVAGYLAYVELTDTRAVCGPVGHCNTVQQSPYAKLFGVLPIGVLGVAGYALILGLWGWFRVRPRHLTSRTQWLLPLAILFGVSFSIYLTFLEPFVIGAVCMWCIGSAVIMTALLWTTVPMEEVKARMPLLGPSEATTRTAEGTRESTVATDDDGSADGGSDRCGSDDCGSDHGSSDDGGAASVAPLASAEPSVLRRIWTVIGYALAALAGLVIAAIVTVYAKTYVFPPPAVTSVAEANQRAAIENATLVAGLVLGVLVWHAVRAVRSR